MSTPIASPSRCFIRGFLPLALSGYSDEHDLLNARETLLLTEGFSEASEIGEPGLDIPGGNRHKKSEDWKSNPLSLGRVQGRDTSQVDPHKEHQTVIPAPLRELAPRRN